MYTRMIAKNGEWYQRRGHVSHMLPLHAAVPKCDVDWPNGCAKNCILSA